VRGALNADASLGAGHGETRDFEFFGVIDDQRGMIRVWTLDADTWASHPGCSLAFASVDGTAFRERGQAAAEDDRARDGPTAVEGFFVENDFVEFFQAIRLFNRCTQRAFPACRQAGFIARRDISFIAGAVHRELLSSCDRNREQRAAKRGHSNGQSPASTPPKHPVDLHASTLAAEELMGKLFRSS
jgi:hypothetical protein